MGEEKPTGVIGHRGVASQAPENTLAGLARARALGVGWVEVDVRLSADGVPLLMHDDTVDRTTSGHGAVAALPMAALAGLDAGGWFDPAFAGEPVPTLAQAAALAARLGLRMILEIKAVAAAPAMGAAWPGGAPVPWVSSFDPEALAAIARACPAWPRALLVEAPPAGASSFSIDSALMTARTLGCRALHMDDVLCRPEIFAVLQQEGLSSAVWTVNDPARAVALWEGGADAIISDRPADLLAGACNVSDRSAARTEGQAVPEEQAP
ncbi:glycerophosphodiester phosphodiesterase family protein [Pararhodospirillum oryzae]|uniref:Glycerophosphodiester phosphodiesterase n=1 Tax=Pararhodospirillum oryzae TaxID=478448 RepID=A0A512HA58_9PROT|nr:glycerophosphodiester phosphodiesterase family protein [Pararhodospirillum oryzae]GEO82325.1 glycerophosphodiester phosphodiesterase [Pararhodospirillum oryzae]